MPFVVGQRYTLGRRFNNEMARRAEADGVAVLDGTTVLVVSEITLGGSGRLSYEESGRPFYRNHAWPEFTSRDPSWFIPVQQGQAEPEDRCVCWNEATQRILPLTGSDGGTRQQCLDQIARWYSNAARTAAQRQDTIFHLVPLRSVERVNINGVIAQEE